jgi:ferredoxin
MKKYKITLINTTKNFNKVILCTSDETIIDAAEKEGVELPYSCKSGSCSTCLGKLISGSINQEDQLFLDAEQKANGFILTCVAYPLSNCEIITEEENNLY